MEPLTRTETLQILKCLGVDLPATTKISEENLDRRLRNALDAAQYKDRLPPTLDFKTLPEWPMLPQPGGRPLFQAVMRGNFEEARRNMAAHLGLGSGQPELFADPFTDLRQTIMGIGKFLDEGMRWCILQDENGQCAVNLRVRRRTWLAPDFSYSR